MRVVVVGATGRIGSAIVEALAPRHEIVAVTHSAGPLHVDLASPRSITDMYRAIGRFDALVSAAGRARYKPLLDLTDEDFAASFGNKLMGQINLVRFGLGSIADGGSFTLTAGFLSRSPSPGNPIASTVNAALEAFGRAAALDVPRGVRLNVVSPTWVTETLQALGRDVSQSTPVAVVARAYVRSVEGKDSGLVIDP